jgi:hypothetical protein
LRVDPGIEERHDIRARAARSHEQTRELGAASLELLGIESMLDAPIHRSGGLLPVDSELSRGTRMRVFLPRVAADR